MAPTRSLFVPVDPCIFQFPISHFVLVISVSSSGLNVECTTNTRFYGLLRDAGIFPRAVVVVLYDCMLQYLSLRIIIYHIFAAPASWVRVGVRLTGDNNVLDLTHNQDALVEFENAPLLPVQRRQRIADFLHHHGAVTLQQLADALHVSLSTLRRDLDCLALEGVVERTHGGAVLKHQQYSTFEPNFAAAVELSPLEKKSIGMVAAEALVPGQSVIFDSGSTVMEVAKAVVSRQIEIIAVTNDIEIARILNASPSVRVHVLGGQLRSGSNTLVGEEVKNGARAIRADVLFLGAHAVTEGVVSETSPEVVAIKRVLMQSASSVRLLVDSSKFRPRVFMSVCNVTDLDEIITDDGAPLDELERIRAAGVKLTVAGKAS